MWIRNMCLGLLFCSGLVCASTVKTGTYVGMQSKRSNLSYYQDEGTYQYVLSFASLASHETMQFHYVGPEQISYGKSYAFKIEPNPYDEETPTSLCVLSATWYEDGRLAVTGNTQCQHSEKHFLSDYAYSAQASVMPEQYRGNWDKTKICGDDRVVILEDVFNPEFYTGAAALISTTEEKDGSLNVIGIEEYERETSLSYLNLKRTGNQLRVRGSHHEMEFDKTVMRCQVAEE